MSLSLEQLSELPSPFYRVTVKALVFDAEQRLLVLTSKAGNTELPGGGWEHGESLEAALQRELQEELGVQAIAVSPIRFTFQATGNHGWRVLRLVVEAKLESHDFQLGPDMARATFIAKEQIADLPYTDPADSMLKKCVDIIWPAEGAD